MPISDGKKLRLNKMCPAAASVGLGTRIQDLEVQALVLGAASGYKLARGETAVTGATGGVVATTLTTVVAVVASLGEDATVDALWVTAALSVTPGSIVLQVWKPTAADGSAANVTPILATVAKKVDWIAIGT